MTAASLSPRHHGALRGPEAVCAARDPRDGTAQPAAEHANTKLQAPLPAISNRKGLLDSAHLLPLLSRPLLLVSDLDDTLVGGEDFYTQQGSSSSSSSSSSSGSAASGDGGGGGLGGAGPLDRAAAAAACDGSSLALGRWLEANRRRRATDPSAPACLLAINTGRCGRATGSTRLGKPASVY